MKKTVLILIFALVMVFSGCSGTLPSVPELDDYTPQATLSQHSGYKTWTSEDGQSLIISYPHRWFAMDEAVNAIVLLNTPLGDDTPDFREYIAFGVQIPQEGQTEQYIADITVADMQQMFPGIQLIHGSRQYVADRWMEYRVFGGRVNDFTNGVPEGDYVWYQYSFLAGGQSYSITLTTTKTMESVYKADFDYITSGLVLNIDESTEQAE